MDYVMRHRSTCRRRIRNVVVTVTVTVTVTVVCEFLGANVRARCPACVLYYWIWLKPLVSK